MIMSNFDVYDYVSTQDDWGAWIEEYQLVRETQANLHYLSETKLSSELQALKVEYAAITRDKNIKNGMYLVNDDKRLKVVKVINTRLTQLYLSEVIET